jgi:hypothetical protein
VRSILLSALLALVAVLAVSTPALADFNGQTILGPLGPGSVVMGDTTGATDDNDGIMSGVHIFEIWMGPDDVYALEWPGGDLELEMVYDPMTGADLDLFLYTPASLDDSGNYSIMNSGIENVLEPAAAAGTYYVLVDSPDFSTAGAYTLSVTPEPGALLLLGLGLTMLARRVR